MPDTIRNGTYIAAYIGEPIDHYPIDKGEYRIAIRYWGSRIMVRWEGIDDLYAMAHDTDAEFHDNWIILEDNPNGKWLFKHPK